MIFEIFIGSISFLAIFFTFVLAITFSMMSLADMPFWEAWQLSYRIGYSDFEDEQETLESKFFFLLATIVMPLIMFNLLIAIMGDIYSRVQANSTEADVREQLTLVEEIGRIMLCMRRGSKLLYLKECRDANFYGADNELKEVDPLEEKLQSMKTDIKELVQQLRVEITA